MTRTASRHRVLILGGTGEALDLAARLAADPSLAVTTSLAGRTTGHRRPAGELRVGGFGGADGLAAYLRAAGVDRLIDATHPFAATVSRHAAIACAQAGVPRLVLLRPPWTPVDGDFWIAAATLEEAAAAVGRYGRRAFLSVGRQALEAFAGRSDLWFLVRLVEAPRVPLALARHAVVIGRGPFPEEAEAVLLAEHRIEVVVSKNSGGGATYGKIAAARQLGLPVVMLERPPPPPGETVAAVGAAVAWLNRPASA